MKYKMPHLCLQRLALTLFFALFQLLPLSSGAPARVQAAPLPRQAVQNTSPWLDAQLEGGILYLLYTSPAQIQRYEIASQTWLSALSLPGAPTAFRVDGSEILVALGSTLARFNLEGAGRTDLWTGSRAINRVLVDDQFAFVCLGTSNGYDYTHSLNRATGQEINNVDDGIYCEGVSIAPGQRKLFSRTEQTAPSDIQELIYSPTGFLNFYWLDSPQHGDYPDAQKTWVFPDESLVVDNSGTVYTTASLTFHTTLLREVDDLAFNGNLPIVLRGYTLYSYDDRLIESGQYTPAQPAQNIFVSGDKVYALRAGAQGPEVEVIPLDMFQPPAPAAPLDAYGLPYTIDDLAFDPDGTVYLMNKASRNILRWSATERKYLGPVTLAREPQFITYSATTGKLSIAYNTKEITQITPTQGLAETPFALLKQVPCALEAAGNVLVACDRSADAYDEHFSTINEAGDELSAWELFKGYQDFTWNSAKSRMYYSYPGSSYLYWFNLSPEWAKISEGDYYIYPNVYKSPNRLSVDQTRLFVGPRSVFDLTSPAITIAGMLPADMTDASWINDTLYTLKAYSTGAQLQKWNANLTLAASQNLTGSPLYLLSTGEGLLAITDFMGRPRFTLWNDQLQPLYQPPAANFSVPGTSVGILSYVQFSNLSQGGEGAAYLWDFGDGQTSTETNPVHIYTQLGKYTITLTVTGPDGEDRSVKTDLIEVVERVYLPVIQILYPTTNYTNACKTFPVIMYGNWHVADMTECVTKIENRGTPRVYFTWKANMKVDECLNKQSDLNNPNMYITDQKGNRYAMVNAGGAASGYISCMVNGSTYTGWFDFPAAKVASPIYTFHDDDNEILIGPLPVP